MRMPKSVKEWVLKVDETEREICEYTHEPYRKVSTGMIWRDDVLRISGCAQRTIRTMGNAKDIYDEFPSEYKYIFT